MGRRERDHPRACGAHGAPSPPIRRTLGSSPRMRGSRVRLTAIRMAGGIIPAHAGLTSRTISCMHFSWDHPRACGAHLPAGALISTRPGSSPRMRGSPAIEMRGVDGDGIIPAHAGLTAHFPMHPGRPGDHPRACGAHEIADLNAVPDEGSSPRMRGSRG